MPEIMRGAAVCKLPNPTGFLLELIGLYWTRSGNDTEDDSDGPDSFKHSATNV
jgi:hypothetical protein